MTKKTLFLSSLAIFLLIPIKAFANSKLTLTFQDEYGRQIKEEIILEGYTGEEYQLDTYNIEGYELKEIIGNKSGIFLNNDSNITYIYKPNIPHTNTIYPDILTTILVLIFILIIKKILT